MTKPPFVPRLYFRESVHYQKIRGLEWTRYVEVDIRPDGWVDVVYADGARVSYPASAFDMIIQQLANDPDQT